MLPQFSTVSHNRSVCQSVFLGLPAFTCLVRVQVYYTGKDTLRATECPLKNKSLGGESNDSCLISDSSTEKFCGGCPSSGGLSLALSVAKQLAHATSLMLHFIFRRLLTQGHNQ